MSGGDWKDMFKGVQNGDKALVEYYLKSGIDHNYQHPEFMASVLVESIRYSHLHITQLLLEHGADPLIKEHWGEATPLGIAQSTNNQAATQLLHQFIKKDNQELLSTSTAKDKLPPKLLSLATQGKIINSIISGLIIIFLLILLVVVMTGSLWLPNGGGDSGGGLIIVFFILLAHIFSFYYFKSQIKQETSATINAGDFINFLIACIQILGALYLFQYLYSEYKPFDWNDFGLYLFDSHFYFNLIIASLYFYGGSVSFIYFIRRIQISNK